MNNIFFYEVLLADGRSRSGVMAIPVERDASARLWLEKAFDGIVVRLYRLPAWLAAGYRESRRLLRGTLNAEALAGLLRDLAVMSGSGIPIVEAIQSVAADSDTRAARRVSAVCRQLMDDLGSGASLSLAFARQPDVFPDTVRSLATIGDETGSMSEMLMEASDHIERISSMKANAKQAMIYPLFSFAAIFGAGAFWIVYVMPKLMGLFTQMNAKLPPFTLAVLAGASWTTAHGAQILAGMLAFFVFAWWSWRHSIAVRRAVYSLLHRLPVAKTILTSTSLAFFAEYLAILTRAGLDVIGSFQILERSIRDLYYKDRVIAMRQFLERGDGISTAMRQVGGFPSMMVRMVAVGEQSGTLDKQLSYLSAEYSVRLKRVVGTLSEIIKPLVIVLAGAVFLLLIIAFLLPVYDLVRQTMGAASR